MEVYKKASISNENEIHQILISISIPNCSLTLIHDAPLRSTRLRCRYPCLRHLHPPRNATTMSNCSMQFSNAIGSRDPTTRTDNTSALPTAVRFPMQCTVCLIKANAGLHVRRGVDWRWSGTVFSRMVLSKRIRKFYDSNKFT